MEVNGIYRIAVIYVCVLYNMTIIYTYFIYNVVNNNQPTLEYYDSQSAADSSGILLAAVTVAFRTIIIMCYNIRKRVTGMQ